jgi:hypothetical protein
MYGEQQAINGLKGIKPAEAMAPGKDPVTQGKDRKYIKPKKTKKEKNKK